MELPQLEEPTQNIQLLPNTSLMPSEMTLDAN
ncbi:uncharacterized protein G2W53_012074 [Senna tora]|uniref:Uncharacterized protein n=1 Tax=Senna tora TaxID=362788 RepID=A0A834U062_9FABA|nr:uncharacterized protein G2W53_012074 [Senna tora]